jgi:hypothetical protein
MKGYGYEFLAIVHAVTVIFTLLWLPFGKFFHIFQRPAQLAVAFYRDVGAEEAPARCARCNEPYATPTHVADLIQVEAELGYHYEMSDPACQHRQHVCPACRRKMLALSQHTAWEPKTRGEGTNGD